MNRFCEGDADAANEESKDQPETDGDFGCSLLGMRIKKPWEVQKRPVFWPCSCMNVNRMPTEWVGADTHVDQRHLRQRPGVLRRVGSRRRQAHLACRWSALTSSRPQQRDVDLDETDGIVRI